MKILYLTTALHEEDYSLLLRQKAKAPNPSNQNFHSKLIAYLEKNNKVQVISRRYYTPSLFAKKTTTDNYFYPGLINVPILRNITTILNSRKQAIDFSPDYIIVDVLNVTLMELAVQIKRRTHAAIIGVVTDNPLNLTNVNKYYSEHVFKKALHCDAFIGLTNSLVKLFNTKHRPNLVVPGFLPLQKTLANKQTEDYVYFGGALYARYGVDVLIETFKNPQPYKLKIAGHGPLRRQIVDSPHENIDFIGLVSPEDALMLSENARININPRPFDSALDEYSIPSKLIDYIFTGVPTISTKNSVLEQIVGNNVFWIGEVSVYCLTNAIRAMNEDYDGWVHRAKKAQTLLNEALGPTAFATKFAKFVRTIKTN